MPPYAAKLIELALLAIIALFLALILWEIKKLPRQFFLESPPCGSDRYPCTVELRN